MTNAEVTLSKDGLPFDFGQSDGNGIVNFDNVPAGGGYTVRAISRARARAGSSATLTVTQSAITSVDIGLSVLGVVSGTLVDGETNPERPIAGGHITLTSNNLTLRTSTDAAGAYRFDGRSGRALCHFRFDFDSGRSTPLPPQEFVLTSTIQELTNSSSLSSRLHSSTFTSSCPTMPEVPAPAAPLVDVTVSQNERYQREQHLRGPLRLLRYQFGSVLRIDPAGSRTLANSRRTLRRKSARIDTRSIQSSFGIGRTVSAS